MPLSLLVGIKLGCVLVRTAYLVRATLFTVLLTLTAYYVYYRIGVFSNIMVIMNEHGVDVFWHEKAYWFVIVGIAICWAIGSGIYNDFKRT